MSWLINKWLIIMVRERRVIRAAARQKPSGRPCIRIAEQTL